MDAPIMRIAHILHTDMFKRCMNTIITTISSVLTIIISRDGGEMDFSENEEDGLVCILHLGRDYPQRADLSHVTSGEIEYKLKSKGRTLDIHKIVGVGRIHSHLTLVLLPLIITLREYKCMVQVKDHIGYRGNSGYLRKLISNMIDITYRSRGARQLKLCEKYAEIFKAKDFTNEDLIYGHVWGNISKTTYQYAYVWYNLMKYRLPLNKMLKKTKTTVYSLENRCRTSIIQSVGFDPQKMLKLIGVLPTHTVVDMLDSLIVKFVTPYNSDYTYYTVNGKRAACVTEAILDHNLNVKTITTADVVALRNKVSDFALVGLFIEVVIRKFTPYVCLFDDDINW